MSVCVLCVSLRRCLFVCVSLFLVCVFVFISPCRGVGARACLDVYVSACLYVCVSACLYEYVSACKAEADALLRCL